MPDVRRIETRQPPQCAQGHRCQQRRDDRRPACRRRASQDDQDRHADHPVGSRRAARHLVAQRGDDGGREGQRRRRSGRTPDRNGDPRFQGPAAGSRPRRPRTRQHRRLRNPDRRRGLVRRVRRAGSGPRPRRALHPHQLRDLVADRRSQDPHPERLPHRAPGRARLDRRRHLRGARSPRPRA